MGRGRRAHAHTPVSIFRSNHACPQPPEPNLELERGPFYSRSHFRPSWCGGRGCLYTWSFLHPPLQPPPLKLLDPAAHVTSRKALGSGRGSPWGLGRGSCGPQDGKASWSPQGAPPISVPGSGDSQPSPCHQWTPGCPSSIRDGRNKGGPGRAPRAALQALPQQQ